MDADVARARLEELLAELDASVQLLDRRSYDAGDNTVVDPADSATGLADADREEASLEVVLAQRERVKEALARIESGSFGRCIDCDRELPEERLEVRPEAARCVDCQQRVEVGR